MAKSFYFSIQSWMLEEMELSLQDVAVFAYINGLTTIKPRVDPDKGAHFFKVKGEK